MNRAHRVACIASLIVLTANRSSPREIENTLIYAREDERGGTIYWQLHHGHGYPKGNCTAKEGH